MVRQEQETALRPFTLLPTTSLCICQAEQMQPSHCHSRPPPPPRDAQSLKQRAHEIQQGEMQHWQCPMYRKAQ